MKRLEVAKLFHGPFYMIICCEKDCTAKEILAFSNDVNPCGTTLGWSYILDYSWPKEPQRPVPCLDAPNRHHVMVGC